MSPWQKLATASATVATTSCRRLGPGVAAERDSDVMAAPIGQDEGADYRLAPTA